MDNRYWGLALLTVLVLASSELHSSHASSSSSSSKVDVEDDVTTWAISPVTYSQEIHITDAQLNSNGSLLFYDRISSFLSQDVSAEPTTYLARFAPASLSHLALQDTTTQLEPCVRYIWGKKENEFYNIRPYAPDGPITLHTITQDNRINKTPSNIGGAKILRQHAFLHPQTDRLLRHTKSFIRKAGAQTPAELLALYHTQDAQAPIIFEKKEESHQMSALYLSDDGRYAYTISPRYYSDIIFHRWCARTGTFIDRATINAPHIGRISLISISPSGDFITYPAQTGVGISSWNLKDHTQLETTSQKIGWLNNDTCALTNTHKQLITYNMNSKKETILMNGPIQALSVNQARNALFAWNNEKHQGWLLKRKEVPRTTIAVTPTGVAPTTVALACALAHQQKDQ